MDNGNMPSFPGTPEEAEAMKYKLSQESKALNFE